MTGRARVGAAVEGRPRPRAVSGSERERLRKAFLAMALSHEIKQPLNSLILNVELLGKRLSRSSDVVEETAGPLAALGRLADRITGCVETYYDHVRPEPVPDAAEELSPILVEAVRRAGPTARRRGVVIELEKDEPLPKVPVHVAQIALALDEVIANAILASERGMRVLVKAKCDDDEVRLLVTDTGAGMEPETARHAVEIGFTTRSAEGIGLTVAKFVAYHHAGGFHIASVPGSGTTVSLVLPVALE